MHCTEHGVFLFIPDVDREYYLNTKELDLNTAPSPVDECTGVRFSGDGII